MWIKNKTLAEYILYCFKRNYNNNNNNNSKGKQRVWAGKVQYNILITMCNYTVSNLTGLVPIYCSIERFYVYKVNAYKWYLCINMYMCRCIRASLVYNNIHCAVNPKITLFKAQELSIQCDRSRIYWRDAIMSWNKRIII